MEPEKVEGSWPMRLLKAKCSSVKDTKEPRKSGMLPLRFVLVAENDWSDVASLMLTGIVQDENGLPSMVMDCNDVMPLKKFGGKEVKPLVWAMIWVREVTPAKLGNGPVKLLSWTSKSLRAVRF